MTGLFTASDHELKANKEMWAREFEEKFLDVRPFFDIHADELPEYHFWSREQNPKIRPKHLTPMQASHHQDMTQVPRFYPNGHPKLPLYRQAYYVPLDGTGRFDWKANERLHHPKPILHRNLWHKSLNQRQRWNTYLNFRPFESIDEHQSVRTGMRHLFKNVQLPTKLKLERTNVGSNAMFSWVVLSLAMVNLLAAASLPQKKAQESFIANSEQLMEIRMRDRGSYHDLLI